ncbi:hypothetical protein [Clostridium minihomine]|uniref:hypothetical protein n=1 Tax=Clostridium minihomine TaxID=2045012 RepID=UPI000C763661|nr:hypothetical protein [Clostridium minihomine]
MKQTLQLIATDCKRAIFSISFVVSVIGIWIVFSWGAHSVISENTDVLLMVQYASSASGTNNLILLFCVLPYTMSFCSDWDSGYIRLVAARSGSLRYAVSKYFSCFFSSCLATTVGMALFILPVTLNHPLVDASAENLQPYITLPTLEGQLLGQGQFVLYFIIYLFLRSLHNGFWATVGLCASVYIPNRFVAVFIPFIGFYVLKLVTYQFPTWLQLSKLGAANFILGGVGFNIMYAVFFFAALLLLGGLLFVKSVKRRVSNA